MTGAALRRVQPADNAGGARTAPRHFLDLRDFETGTLRRMLDLASSYKAGTAGKPLAGKTVALIFEKPSTRTRVSFEVGVRQLGPDNLLGVQF